MEDKLDCYLAKDWEQIKEFSGLESFGINWEEHAELSVLNIDTDYEEKLREFQQDSSIPSYDSNTVTWRVKLSLDGCEKFYDNYIEKFLEKVNTKHFEHSNQVHRGHYLAYSFKEFLVRINPKCAEYKVNHFFGNGNPQNIYYQSVKSNLNSKSFHGQAYYEDKIYKYLNSAYDGRYVFYEIQDVRACNDQNVSLGRRILAVFSNNETGYEDFHVFIPNIYDEGISEPEPEED